MARKANPASFGKSRTKPSKTSGTFGTRRSPPLPQRLGRHSAALGDYPLNITDSAMEQLVELFRDVQPHIVLTHIPIDSFNPDLPVASQTVQKARLLASSARVASAF